MNQPATDSDALTDAATGSAMLPASSGLCKLPKQWMESSRKGDTGVTREACTSNVTGSIYTQGSFTLPRAQKYVSKDHIGESNCVRPRRDCNGCWDVGWSLCWQRCRPHPC
jgi:hypothetical protein